MHIYSACDVLCILFVGSCTCRVKLSLNDIDIGVIYMMIYDYTLLTGSCKLTFP